MKLLVLIALIAANLLPSSAVPIPQTRVISPYVTQFTQRTVPHPLRSRAAGLVSRIPAVLNMKREDPCVFSLNCFYFLYLLIVRCSNDIFLARALEDTVFASARDIVAQRSSIERSAAENVASS
ncbi:hypothetical protein C8R43DRAFT_494284 [Mycena crocata]|nr:hypothetical protein C8R43DRAFT_494284 [Mycena crocata]